MRNGRGEAGQARALVIGGSAGGLLAAATLRCGGWRADVYERSSVELVGRGAGIATHPELAEALDESGVGSHELGLPVTYRLALDKAGAVVARRHHPQTVTSWDRIHQIAREATPDDCYHLGHELVSVSQTEDGVTATFANGSTESGDVLVGADGFRSVVRGVYRPDVRPEYAGYVIWRGLVDEADLPSALHQRIFDHFTFYFPPRYESIGYPIPGRDNDLRPGHRRYNWVWYAGATAEQLLDILTDASGKQYEFGIPPGLLRPEIVAAMRAAAREVVTAPLLDALDLIPQPFVTPVYDFCSPEFAFGRVALLGDAAVTARPHVGYGTTKAACDAVALGRALNAALADGREVAAALRAYEAERQPIGRSTFLRSRQLGSWMGVPFPGDAADVLDDAELHTLPGILRHTGSNEFLTGREPGWMMEAELGDFGAAQ